MHYSGFVYGPGGPCHNGCDIIRGFRSVNEPSVLLKRPVNGATANYSQRRDSEMKLATSTTLITNGQLINGTGKPTIPNASVITENRKITFAGPASTAPLVPPTAQRIDANGGTIMPGLADAQ